MKKLYTEANIQMIADAIRDKLGTDTKYKVSEMASAILSIPTDGTVGAGGKNYVYITDENEAVTATMPHDVNTVWLFSDTILSPDITLDDIECDAVTSVQFINRLLLKLTLDTTKIHAGDTFKIRVKKNGYLHHNGGSIQCRLPVSNTLDLFDQTSLGSQIITSTYSDQGTCNISLKKYSIIGFADTLSTLKKSRDVFQSCSVDGNCCFKAGNITLYVNGRDNGYQIISLYEMPMDDVGSLIRVTWNGYMPYSQSEANRGIWDVYFLGNGDFYIRITSLGTNSSGAYQINGQNFKNPGVGGYVSVYRKNYYGTAFEIVYEKYDPSKHDVNADNPIKNLTLIELMMDKNGLSYCLKNDVDDSTYTYSNELFQWPYAGKTYSSLYVSTNSWIGVTGSSNEEIRINRQDAKAHLFSHGNYHITDLDIDCYKFRWEGYSYYRDGSANQIWELYLFENGDAMLRMEKMQGNKSGTFSFFGTVFSISEGECVSFYRVDESSGKFTAVNEVYDITKHVA